LPGCRVAAAPARQKRWGFGDGTQH
jgi:hypothetical protein